jgi:N utilization substance protein A
VPREVIFEAIEAALASAARSATTTRMCWCACIDSKDGNYETFRRWEVVADACDGVAGPPDPHDGRHR